MKTAFADLGTNMAKLLVASWGDQELIVHHEQDRYIRLGEGMGKSGEISPAALERMRLALVEFKHVAKQHKAPRLFAAGTSALRDASNSTEAVDLALRRAGVPVEILSGRAEARLTFVGACSAVRDLTAPVAVFDIGGGSTEVAIGDPVDNQMEQVESLPLGSVRLSEDIAGPNPMRSKDAEAVRAHIEGVLREHHLTSTINALVAGTATANILAEINGTPRILTKHEVDAWAGRLLGMSTGEILQLNPGRLKGRADVYPAGVLILQAIMEYFSSEACHVSSRRMIHGLAIRHFQP